MSARMKGREREVGRLLADVARWASSCDDVRGVVLVGSFARSTATMASDVDLVVLAEPFRERADDTGWFEWLRPGSRLVRAGAWGPVLERRFRLRSGLVVELGLASPRWVELPLDPGTRRVLADGHRVVHDPDALLARAAAAVSEGSVAPASRRLSRT